MNVFVFDIETVPDVKTGARLFGLGDLDSSDVAEIMFRDSLQRTGSEFLRHHLHQVVAISVVLRAGERFKVWSLGTPESDEKELLERFFDGLEKFSPTLVSWNGGGFDLPVLHYRSLLHGVCAPRYWETGDEDSSFRYNNYLNRFHHRHTDLMDELSGYQPRASARLDDMATLLGLPGKMGMHGGQVFDAFQRGERSAIRDYCETDVLNTYLIYLRYQLIRGRLSNAAYELECTLVKDTLEGAPEPHLQAFLSAWRATGGHE